MNTKQFLMCMSLILFGFFPVNNAYSKTAVSISKRMYESAKKARESDYKALQSKIKERDKKTEKNSRSNGGKFDFAISGLSGEVLLAQNSFDWALHLEDQAMTSYDESLKNDVRSKKNLYDLSTGKLSKMFAWKAYMNAEAEANGFTSELASFRFNYGKYKEARKQQSGQRGISVSDVLDKHLAQIEKQDQEEAELSKLSALLAN